MLGGYIIRSGPPHTRILCILLWQARNYLWSRGVNIYEQPAWHFTQYTQWNFVNICTTRRLGCSHSIEQWLVRVRHTRRYTFSKEFSGILREFAIFSKAFKRKFRRYRWTFVVFERIPVEWTCPLGSVSRVGQRFPSMSVLFF